MSQPMMVCRGCGAKISMIGKVCPHCQRDKTADAKSDANLMLSGVGGGILGMAIGAAVGNRSGFLSGMIGTFIGAFIGAIAGLVSGFFMSSRRSDPPPPPEVRISNAPADFNVEAPSRPEAASKALSQVSVPSDKVEERLSRLKRLHDQGLINDEEFQTKRAALLNAI